MGHRENNFDAIRLVAAAAVIYGHAFPLTASVAPGFFGNWVQGFAVKIFFVISGYLIATSWRLDPRLGPFFLKRALRIFPALVVVVFLAIAVVGPWMTTLPLSDYAANPGTRAYLKNVLMNPQYALPGVFDSLPYAHAVNGSLWTLPVELLMYLLLPAVGALAAVRRLRAMPALVTAMACAASLWLIRIHPVSTRPIVYGTDLLSALDIGPYFLLGACVCFYRLERWLNPTAALGAIGLALLLQPTGAGMELSLYGVTPLAVLSFALHPVRGLSRAGRFGDFSYGLYLYGFMIQQVLNQLFHGQLGPLENAALAFPLTAVVALASWHAVEKQALKWKRVASARPAVDRTAVENEPAVL